MQTTNFNTKFTDFGQKFILGQAKISPGERANAQQLYRIFLAEFFEQLLLFDRISIRIYRDNVALAILINELGLDLVQECVEDGTIELFLWRQSILMTSGQDGKGEFDDSYLKGIPPVVAVKFSSPQHSVPEESVKQAFNWVNYQYERNERRRFTRAVTKKIKLDEGDFADTSTKLVIGAYEANHLAELGLPFNKPSNDLNFKERTLLLDLTHNIIDTSFLSSKDYTSFNKYKSTLIAQSSLEKIGKAYKLQDGLNKIINLEKLPDLQSIFLNNKIDFYTAVKLRKKQISKEFRKWLSEATDKADIEYITKQYIDEITNDKGYFETHKGKIIKTVSLATIGAGIGVLTGGIGGAILGGAIPKILDMASDLGLGFFDSFLLENLTKGWTPRMFMDEIRNEINKDD